MQLNLSKALYIYINKHNGNTCAKRIKTQNHLQSTT